MIAPATIVSVPWASEVALIRPRRNGSVPGVLATGSFGSEVASRLLHSLPPGDEVARIGREIFARYAAPRGAPDDLVKLPGIGPQIVKKLNDAGIYHYWQIAAMTPENAAKIDHDLKLAGRIERDGWVALARGLVAG